MQSVLPMCHTLGLNHYVHVPLLVNLPQSGILETLEAAKTMKGGSHPEEEREKANIMGRLCTAAMKNSASLRIYFLQQKSITLGGGRQGLKLQFFLTLGD